MKSCKTCKQELPITSFYGRKKKETGVVYYSAECNECGKEANRARAKKWGQDNPEKNRKRAAKHQKTMKAMHESGELKRAERATCGRCGEEKEAGAFVKVTGTKSGLRAWCKSCDAEYYQDNKRDPLYVPTIDEKACSKCRDVKKADEFGGAFHNHDGLQSYCKPCNATYQKDRYHGPMGWKVRLNNAIRRGRVREAEGSCSQEEWQGRMDLYKGCCGICDKPLKSHDGILIYDIDHIYPLAKGGSNWPSKKRPSLS
jgi:hypothetical protein